MNKKINRKAKEIHHTCRCTGKQYTFKEWCEWLKLNDINSVQAIHKCFSFNIQDVCLTPNKVVEWENKYCKFQIFTAQSPNGLWSYGLNDNYHFSFHRHGASFIDKKEDGFLSEKEAVYAALLETERHCRKIIEETINRNYTDDDTEMRTSVILPYLKQALKQIEKYKEIFNSKQLELW